MSLRWTWSIFAKPRAAAAARDIGAALELRIIYDEIRIQRKGSREPRSDYRLIPVDTDIVLRAAERLEIGGLSIAVGAQPGDCQTGTVLVLQAGCELRLRTRRPVIALAQKAWAGGRASSKTG